MFYGMFSGCSDVQGVRSDVLMDYGMFSGCSDGCSVVLRVF